jgi:hypothetical protein
VAIASGSAKHITAWRTPTVAVPRLSATLSFGHSAQRGSAPLADATADSDQGPVPISRMAQLFSQGPMCARHANQGTNAATNAGTNECRIATARNNPKVVSGNDRKAFESCTFTDLLVAVGTVGVSLAVKRFVGSIPIASTRKRR